MKTRTILKILSAMLITATLTGCCNCGKSSRSARSIANTTWKMIQLDGKSIDAGDGFWVSFLSSGRLAGVGACNRLMASWELTNDKGGIKIGTVASTRMACPGMDQEYAFTQMLESVDSFEIQADNLYLFVNSELHAVMELTDNPRDMNGQ